MPCVACTTKSPAFSCSGSTTFLRRDASFLTTPLVAADRAPVELGLGEHGELRVRRLEAALEHRTARRARRRAPGGTRTVVDPSRRDPALGEHVARALDEPGSGCRDHDAPAVGEQLADVRRRAVDVALERRHRRPRHADRPRTSSATSTSMRPSAAASASPESNALSVHHDDRRAARAASRSAGRRQEVAGAEVDRRLAAPAVAALHAASRNSRFVSPQGDRAGDGALGVDERDRRRPRAGSRRRVTMSSTSAGMSDSMPSTGMPSAIFSSMPAEAGELVLQLPCALADAPR